MLSKLFKLLAVAALMLCILLAVGIHQTQRYLDTPMQIPAPGLEYSLQRGATLTATAYDLARQGILTSPRWLTLYARASGRGHAIKAGDYWLEPELTPRQLLQKLEAGDIMYFQLTLVEGWTLRQVMDYLASQDRLQQTLQYPLTAEQLGVDWQGSLEGMLFPDTYRFHSGDSDKSVLLQAWLRLQQVLSDEWPQRKKGLPYSTPYEALIMASLVEKETGYAPERPIIAGVFVRRLEKKMRLQTDPTVIYGLGDNFDGNLRSRHLRDANNLYNTYRHHGLPPTPIALAGREAIRAALNPQPGTALYFVARGDGSHYFSDTLEQHQRAVRKYQVEQRKKDYSSSPPPDAYLSTDPVKPSQSI